ncbi:tRNA-splicing endonuclease subunit [Massospora cicadina]|nr:tRNA-splicing endonuclease subunit [Massospora cicadina]
MGNHDFQLLLWNPADIKLLRSRYRLVCNFIGCLPTNPLQNLDHSVPALVSYEQLLILLEVDDLNSPAPPANNQPGGLKINLELLTPPKSSSPADFNGAEELARALPSAPPPLLQMLSRLRASARYAIYAYLYALPQNLFITSGSKFGGDFLLYYDDPAKCHSQHIVNVVDFKQPIKTRQLVSFGRLATGVGKTRVLAAVESARRTGQPPTAYLFTLEWSAEVKRAALPALLYRS